MANIERLEQLKRVVRDAPDDVFNMRDATKCACGMASVDPWFLANTNITDNALVTMDRVFDIQWETCVTIFFYNVHPTTSKEQVIANIDRVIAGKPAKRYRTEGAED